MGGKREDGGIVWFLLCRLAALTWLPEHAVGASTLSFAEDFVAVMTHL